MLPPSAFRSYLMAGLLLSLLALPRAQGANSLKLYMKDGSYQIVSSYEVQGDRVRYFSTERSEWEEVPVSMVDLEATRRGQEEAKATEKREIQEAKEVDKERFYKPPNTGLEVVSGIRLPGDEGVFTVDRGRLVRLAVSAGEPVTDKKRAAMVLAVPLPVVKARSLVVLEGAKAAIRLNDPRPVFYVQSASGLGSRLELVRMKPGKETRVLEEIETGKGKNAKSTEERSMIAVERKQIAPNVYSLTPLQTLEGGEYALGEVGADDKLSLDVWDFGYEKWEVVK